jgi:hypothetical protein
MPKAIRRRFTLALLTLASAIQPLKAKDFAVHNEFLIVRYDTTSGQIALEARPHHELVATGRLSADAGTARTLPIADDVFGHGNSIEVSHTHGNSDTLSLFPKLPFVLFRSSLHNDKPEPMIVERFKTVSIGVSLRRPSSALKMLGTGGLASPEENPGSYAWLSVADPETRHGLVSGWLTFDRGSGVVLSRTEGESVRVDAQIDYGRLRIAPGHSEKLEVFAVGYFDDARLGLEAWADALALLHHVKLPPQPAGYCTWYSRPHGGASDEGHLAEQAAFARQNLAPFGFSVVQIDDGWQAGVSTNGPKRNFTTHAIKGPYPSGMKAAADMLRTNGLVPGLWFMPFAGTWYDPFFKNHSDWFVRQSNGEVYQTPWGGTSLDLTQPPVREFLRTNIQRIAHDWGFQYFKMDGLWTGTATRQMYVNDLYRDDGIGDAIFHDPERTNLEAYRTGLKLVRETAGPGVFLLGCCTPQNMRSYGAAFGLVDAMRIGPDNAARWQDLMTGPSYGSRQYFLHGRVWYNDPDPVYVRTNLPISQAQLICSWVAISGQMDLSSEWFPSLPAERLDILKRTMPNHGLLPRPVDLFENPIPRIWLLTDQRRMPRRDVLALYNWSDHEITIKSALKKIGLAEHGQYVAFDYWNDQMLTLSDELNLPIPAQSGRVLAVRPFSDHPQLLSTSRHISQGIVDVREESWNGWKKALSGKSELVAHDPYELRVSLPTEGTRWSLKSITASAQAPNGEVRVASQREEPGLVRVNLMSETSGLVQWELRFERGR